MFSKTFCLVLLIFCFAGIAEAEKKSKQGSLERQMQNMLSEPDALQRQFALKPESTKKSKQSSLEGQLQAMLSKPDAFQRQFGGRQYRNAAGEPIDQVRNKLAEPQTVVDTIKFFNGEAEMQLNRNGSRTRAKTMPTNPDSWKMMSASGGVIDSTRLNWEDAKVNFYSAAIPNDSVAVVTLLVQ